METKHPKEEMTLVLIKPDGVKRGLIGEIIRRIEQRGLKVIAMQMFQPTREQMDNHYPKNEEWLQRIGNRTLENYKLYGYDPLEAHGTDDSLEIGKLVRGWLIDYMSSAPLVKMVVKGIHAIDMVRKLVGNTMPYKAEMGTIRGDYSVDSPAAANRDQRAVHNIVHASETLKEAEHELDEWFSPEEIFSYKRAEEDIMF